MTRKVTRHTEGELVVLCRILSGIPDIAMKNVIVSYPPLYMCISCFNANLLILKITDLVHLVRISLRDANASRVAWERMAMACT